MLEIPKSQEICDFMRSGLYLQEITFWENDRHGSRGLGVYRMDPSQVRNVKDIEDLPPDVPLHVLYLLL